MKFNCWTKYISFSTKKSILSLCAVETCEVSTSHMCMLLTGSQLVSKLVMTNYAHGLTPSTHIFNEHIETPADECKNSHLVAQ